MFLAATVFAWTMETGWLESLLQNIPYYAVHCPEGRCAGAPAVFRVMAALATVHLILALLLIGVKSSLDGRAGLQNGYVFGGFSAFFRPFLTLLCARWWGPKIILWLGLTTAYFFVPNGVFTPYGVRFFIFLCLFLPFFCPFIDTFLIDRRFYWRDWLCLHPARPPH